MKLVSVFAILVLLAFTYGQYDNCQVSGITLATQVQGVGLNYSVVLNHLQSSNISFANASTHFLACVDGRSASGILGTPGGDTGEFLAAIATFISLGGSIQSQENMSKLLDDFIALETIQRPFYMHSDDHAMERLEETLGAQVPNFTIANVSAQYQSIVLEEVVKPEHIGCGHLRSVVSSPVDYQIPFNITRYYIRSFFDFMWNGYTMPKLTLHIPDYEVLHYNHSEKAVLNVYTDITSAGRCAAAAPLVIPRGPNSSLFVNHPDFVNPMRTELSNYFSKILNMSAVTFRSAMDSIARSQLNQTLARLAPGFPIYGVTIKVTEKNSSLTSSSLTSSSLTSGSLPITSGRYVAPVGTTGAIPATASDDHFLYGLVPVLILVILGIAAGGIFYLYKKRARGPTTPSSPRNEEDVVQLEEVAD